MKKKDDEVDKHPFYSDFGKKQWQKRSKELEQIEKELGKRRKDEKDHSSPEGIEQNVHTTGKDGEIVDEHG